MAADDSWIHYLGDDELAELGAAAEHVTARGLAAGNFKREDFPLPTLAGRIDRIWHELEYGRGCVLIKGLDITRFDMPALKALYWGLGVHLGLPITQNAKGDLIGHVTDGGREYQSENVRGYTTNDALRFHCDSADAVSLLCVHHARSGGDSLIASAITIFNEMLQHYPQHLETLSEGFYFDLRGEGASGDPNEVTRHKVPVFSYFDGRLSARYNQKTIEDGQAKAGEPLAGSDLEAVRCVAELANREDIRLNMTFERGDVQILNNHMVFHAREAFEDFPEPERKRNLLRLWFNIRNGRKLHPAFAERLNTGPRGGVAVKGRDC